VLAGTPGVVLPKGGTATLVPGEVSASLPIELRADAVVPSRRALETGMATAFKNKFLDALEATAEARGEARMVLEVLDSGGIAVPGQIRDQILACADTNQLEAWGRKAAVAESIEEIFGTGQRRVLSRAAREAAIEWHARITSCTACGPAGHRPGRLGNGSG
jgi:hypothetical protein